MGLNGKPRLKTPLRTLGIPFFFRSFLRMVWTPVVVVVCPGLWAAITPTGSIGPTYDSADPWSIPGDLTVGLEDDGTVSVSSGSDVQVGGNVYLAWLDGVLGIARVTGSGSTFEAGGLVTGAFGEGILDVNEGGQVTGQIGVVGEGPDAVGTVSIHDANSVWNVAGGVIVGAWGEGRMTISEGGKVSPGVTSGKVLSIGGFDVDRADFDSVMLADFGDPKGTGTVTVTGEGSTLNVSSYNYGNDLWVGFGGTGTLNVLQGGQLTSDQAGIAVLPGSTGTVTISGNNSYWDNSLAMFVGGFGTGSLTMSDGGRVESSYITVGGFSPDEYGFGLGWMGGAVPNGAGTVKVTGLGSTLQTGNLTVGFTRHGFLEIADQGVVNAECVAVGSGSIGGVAGTVEVHGSGSLLDVTDLLRVGIRGTGSLNVSDGGQVNSDDLLLGYGATGFLNVDNGGRVASVTSMMGVLATMGSWPAGAGMAEVSGPNSLWASETLVVGAWGRGDLTVAGGGSLLTQDVFIGGLPMDRAFPAVDDGIPWGTGTVTVTGESSVLDGNIASELYVGYYLSGTLDVNEGGRVNAGWAALGGGWDAVGTVTVHDAHSALHVAGELLVAAWGQGDLTISEGGQVTAGEVLIGGFDVNEPKFDRYMGNNFGEANGIGAIVVTGAGSSLAVQGDLCVGYLGTGTVTVAAGGQLISEDGCLGDRAAASGTVRVQGEGSLWQVHEDLFVGGNEDGPGGMGVLTVSEGGEVQVGHKLFIRETGTLKGDGIVSVSSPGTLYNYGTIAPGSSIGSLSVEGTVIFEPNSTFEVEIANDNTSDKLVVDGSVTINGGTVKAVASETIVGSHEYRIIEADSVTGTFDGLNTALVKSVTDPSLGYDETSVWLRITALPFDNPNIWRTRNQRAVGEALQQIAEQGVGNLIAEDLQAIEDLNDVRHSYDQLCGQTRPTLAPITEAGISRFMGTVSDRMNGGLMSRPGSFGGRQALVMAGPTAALGLGGTQEANPYGQVFAVGNGSSVLPDRPWGIWGKGYGLFGDRESKDGVPGYQYTTYGFGMGADYQIKEGLLAGVTLGFSDGQADYFSSRDESGADALHVGGYARLTRGAWYAYGLVTYSSVDYSTDRYVDLTGDHLVAEFEGRDLSGYFEAGFQWRDLGGWEINPLTALQVSFLDVDGYTETGGASALTFSDQSYESVAGSLGARVIKDLSERLRGLPSVWEIRGRWVHEFGDAQSVVDASFASDPTVVFEVADAEKSRDSAAFGTGFSAQLNARTWISADYDVRVNADDTTHVLGVVGGYRW